MIDSVKKIVCSKPGMIAALGVVGSASAFASDNLPVIPQTNVDVAGYATAAISALGSVAAVAVGGYVAFLLVRKGLSWLRRI